MTEAPDRFRFLESQSDREPTERPLRAIAEVVRPIDIADAAQRFVRLHTTDHRGEIREPEAALQNRVLSWRYGGYVADPDKFAKAFTRIAQDTAGGEQCSAEVRQFVIGVEGALLAVRAREDDARQEQFRHPDRRQFLGLNAGIDASNAIDVVDIRYDAGISPTIHSIALVQAKAGIPSPTEIADILGLHRAYHREHLLPLTAIEERERLRAAEATVRERLSSSEAREQTHAQYLNALLEVSTITTPDAERIARAARDAGLSPVVLHLFLRLKESHDFFRDMLRETGGGSEDIVEGERRWHTLHAWALRETLPLESLRAFLPDWKLASRFLLATAFSSMTYGNGVLVYRKTLNAPRDEPRILTVH